MRIVRKPIEMIAWFTADGVPNPIRFRIKDSEESRMTINVDRIIKRDLEKLAGNKMIIFTCQSFIDGAEKLYEVKYEHDTCKWMLFKI